LLLQFLLVAFRPIALKEYEDVIEFATGKGKFLVPVKVRVRPLISRVLTVLKSA